jgi:uncharacterized membrane protein YvbJ
VPPDAGSKPAWEMQTHRPETETALNGMMGRQKKDGNHSPSKNKSVQYSEGNEQNGYPVLDSNKTKTNYPKEPNEAHTNTLKEEITENFMEMLLDKVNQKQINEIIGTLNKYQSETENPKNRDK